MALPPCSRNGCAQSETLGGCLSIHLSKSSCYDHTRLSTHLNSTAEERRVVFCLFFGRAGCMETSPYASLAIWRAKLADDLSEAPNQDTRLLQLQEQGKDVEEVVQGCLR